MSIRQKLQNHFNHSPSILSNGYFLSPTTFQFFIFPNKIANTFSFLLSTRARWSINHQTNSNLPSHLHILFLSFSQTPFSLSKILDSDHTLFFTRMARTKTASRVRSQSPPNAANDQPSDHSPLNETPLHTIIQ